MSQVYARPVSKFVLCFGIALIVLQSGAHSLGCFKCTSVNNSLPQCEDTFSNTGGLFQPNCQAARIGRAGLFPATECLKIKFADPSTQTTTLVRTCVVDNGGNSDNTEIGRRSHCGPRQRIVWQGSPVSGCVLTCRTDGCNRGCRVRPGPPLLVLLLAMVTTFMLAPLLTHQ